MMKKFQVKIIDVEQKFMDMFILLTIFQMSSLNEAYEFSCPSQAHWNIRAKSICDPPRNYTCLFDVTFRVNVYRERCRKPRLLAPGYKYVFQPDLNRATCSVTRYQPFNFDTILSSDCTYQKSLCNSLGQEAYERRNTSVDRKCICNTDGGFRFVQNSQNKCYCNPSTDDCSCYQGRHPYNTTGRLKDIKCYEDKKMWSGLYREDILNVSTIQMFEFDNYKYNLNYVPTNKFRIEAVKWVSIVSLTYSIICISLLINRRRLRACIQYFIKHFTTTENLVQTSVTCNLPVSVTLRIKVKLTRTENLYINNCIKIGNTLVFTDYYNKLIICNSDGTDVQYIPLSYKPWYIAEIDSNRFAVSCISDSTILIINISTTDITSTIKTSSSCYGISYNDNNLYVVIDRGIIQVMDITGKVTRSIYLPSNIIGDITVDRGRLVCIDETSIYCCSIDGKLIWILKKDNIKDLRGVTTDDEGNVYVTNCKNNNVVFVSDDGKHDEELLSNSDELNVPSGIYVHKKENILLVCNYYDGNAFIFDVKRK